jgi:hypothetical protein
LAITTGTNNVIIGHQAGSATPNPALTGCILIGNNAGMDNNNDNRLMIHNSSNSIPLIHGDFFANTLDLNGRIRLGEYDDETKIHEIWGPTQANAGGILFYLQIYVNSVLYLIPLHQYVP